MNQQQYHSKKLHNYNDQTFKTTYGTSYTDINTLECSPVYKQMREPNYGDHDNQNSFHQHPYTTDREPNQYHEGFGTHRSRFEDSTLRRDQYQPPLPNRDHYIERERIQPPGDTRINPEDYGLRLDRPVRRDEYQNQLVDENQEKNENSPSFCNRCFKNNTCVNRLSCCHQFCDECMARMPSSDNPFRDRVHLHYCCDICKSWTTETRLARLDPYGRRLVSLHHMRNFSSN